MRIPNPRFLLIAAALLGGCTSPPSPPEPSLVATVRQAGPVGYRDPLGVLSPDGQRLATMVPSRLLIHDLPAGTQRSLAAGEERILHLTWKNDRELVVGQPEDSGLWWRYDIEQGTRQPLWTPGVRLVSGAGDSVTPDRLRDLSWSRDGRRGAGVEPVPQGSRLWEFDSNGLARSVRRLANRVASPFWMPDGRVGCLAMRNGRQRLTLPCGETVLPGLEERDAYGPVAVSPDGGTLYVSLLNGSGFVGLWAWSLDGSGRELATGKRDTYAPSVSRDGTVLYKDQDYGTEVLVMPAAGGAAVPRTTFQAETPSWDPTGTRLGVTYGTWRRVSDDFNYPDIAQDVGIIRADGAAPATDVDQVVQRSGSEDQGLTWSPNGRWIAFHSHQQNSDDVWLRPAERDSPLTRISSLGRGAEVGWPRWSPDGKWIVFDGDWAAGAERRSQLWIVGVDQETGRVMVPAHPIPVTGLTEDVVHAEWLGSSDTIVFSTASPPLAHTFYRVARQGGAPRVMHRYQSPQRIDGFGVGPGGAWLVYPAPDRNVRLQLFRISTRGGDPEPLTSDSTDKTQPAVSPDGSRIAYTSWRYRARFWLLRP